MLKLLSNKKFNYFKLKNSKNKVYKFEGYILYLLSLKNTVININDKNIILKKNQLVKILNKNKKITLDFNISHEVIVTYSSTVKSNTNRIFIKKKHYKVVKPWGYEVWYSGCNTKFNLVLKKIFLKKGFRTSLQYHRKKMESNYLYSGKAISYFNYPNIKVNKKNINKAISKLKNKKLTNDEVLNVLPYQIHRIKSITDCIFYETSTNFLDDVIRVQDDTQRKSGRISVEHKF